MERLTGIINSRLQRSPRHCWDTLQQGSPGHRGRPETSIAISSTPSGLPPWLSWSRICLQWGRPGFNPWVGKMLWRRERLPTPIFLPRQFHGQRSLAGYHLRDHKESGHDWATFASLHWHPLPYMKRHPKITSHFRSKWTGLYTHRHHQQVVKKTA